MSHSIAKTTSGFPEPNPHASASVLYVLTFLPTYIHREIDELIRRGVAVDVVLPQPTDPPSIWDAITRFDGPENRIRAHRIMPYQWLGQCREELLTRVPPNTLAFIANSDHASRLAERSLTEGVFAYFMIAAQLAHKLENLKHVHAHFAKDAAEVGALLAELSGVPFTLTTHAKDIFVPEHPDRLARLLERSSQIYTVSDFNRAHLAGIAGERVLDRVRMIRLGVDIASLPARLPTEEVPRILCTASGLVEKKGVPYLIEACSILKHRGIEFRCTIAGGDQQGTRLPELREHVRKLGLKDEVELPGVVPHTELMRRLSTASVFVHPSVVAQDGDMDGIPVSLIEAMGIGVPVVSTCVSGIPELVVDRESGTLVQPADAIALADAIARVFESPEHAEQMARRGRESVRTGFTLECQIDQMIAHWPGHECEAVVDRPRASTHQEASQRKPISAMVRVRNEADYLYPSVSSIVDHVDEVVLIDNLSTDGTAQILETLRREHRDKITLHAYPYRIRRVGHENWELWQREPERSSMHLSANYYNWCLARCRHAHVLKWDGDMVALDALHQALDDWRRSDKQILIFRGSNLHPNKTNLITAKIRQRDPLLARLKVPALPKWATTMTHDHPEPRLFPRFSSEYRCLNGWTQSLVSPFLDPRHRKDFAHELQDDAFVHLKFCKEDPWAGYCDDLAAVMASNVTVGPPASQEVMATIDRWRL